MRASLQVELAHPCGSRSRSCVVSMSDTHDLDERCVDHLPDRHRQIHRRGARALRPSRGPDDLTTISDRVKGSRSRGPCRSSRGTAGASRRPGNNALVGVGKAVLTPGRCRETPLLEPGTGRVDPVLVLFSTIERLLGRSRSSSARGSPAPGAVLTAPAAWRAGCFGATFPFCLYGSATRVATGRTLTALASNFLQSLVRARAHRGATAC